MKLSNVVNKNLFKLQNIVAYLTRYAAESHSDAYVYGFELDGSIYMVDWDNVKEATFEVSHNTDSFQPTVRLRCGLKEHRKMVEKATRICSSDEFYQRKADRNYNTKGATFESFVWDFFGVEGYKPDNRDFRTTSDIDGLRMQIKFERGTFDLGKDYDYSFLKVID